MCINPEKLLTPIAIVLLSLVASCKDRAAPSSASAGDNPPGAKNEGPAIQEFLYKDLGYKKGIITKDDLPFSGCAIQHHADGTLKFRWNYVNGLLDGLVEEWYENAQRSTYKLYKKGMRHGITRYWDENGTPTKQVLYKNDKEIEEITETPVPQNTGQSPPPEP